MYANEQADLCKQNWKGINWKGWAFQFSVLQFQGLSPQVIREGFLEVIREGFFQGLSLTVR